MTILRVVVGVGLTLGLLVPASAAEAEPTPAEIQAQITRFSHELEKVVEQYNRVTEELKASRAAAAQLTASLGQLGEQLTTAQAEIGEVASTAYKKGQLSEISALLSATSGRAFVDRVGTLAQLARGRQARVDGFQAAKGKREEEKRKLDAVLAKQAAQVKELTDRKAGIKRDLDKLYALRRAAYGRETSGSSGGYTGTVPAISGAAGIAVSYAYGAIGKPYEWGADGPDSYDCSGLTMAAWRKAGKSLPHNAAMQWDTVAHISRSELKPGDLVFYSGLGHVALYVGSGKVIHSPTFGEYVKIANYDMMPPYGYGRVR